MPSIDRVSRCGGVLAQVIYTPSVQVTESTWCHWEVVAFLFIRGFTIKQTASPHQHRQISQRNDPLFPGETDFALSTITFAAWKCFSASPYSAN